MTWEDMNDTLYDGTEEEIRACRCSECGGEITWRYEMETRSLEVKCMQCGMTDRHHGTSYIPNCAKLPIVANQSA